MKTNLQYKISKISNKTTVLDYKLNGKICNIDIKIDNLDTKFADQFNFPDSKLNNLEVHIHTVDNRMDRVEIKINSKIDDLDIKIKSVCSQIDVLNTKVTN